MIPRLRYFLASPWAIAFTVLVSILLGIGSFPLFDVDEGAFSEASREMVETGNFAATWLDGEPRYDKPIFSYWMQAASISIFGHSEWAFRLPSALATIAWLVVLWRFGLAHLGRRRAIAAVLLLGNCLWVGLIGKAAIADAWLNLWLTLALLDIYRYFEADGERRSLALMVFLWMGLGFLTKGPVAVAIPLLVAIAFFVPEGRWRDLLRAGLDPAGIGIF
ncbi:MAG: glycosyltransferase family 39 protein, partial [Pseudomonadales bacterium]|nr:glycosyltransferase family 39 protein [Pseudomonadales bacterium]